MNDEQKVLICCRADAPVAVRGSVYTHHCSECGSRVMTAPSGQAFLKANPGTPILCMECYEPRESDQVITAAPHDQMRQEASTAIPNLYRERN